MTTMGVPSRLPSPSVRHSTILLARRSVYISGLLDLDVMKAIHCSCRDSELQRPSIEIFSSVGGVWAAIPLPIAPCWLIVATFASRHASLS